MSGPGAVPAVDQMVAVDGDRVGRNSPDSRIFVVKVAGATGETDIAHVIAGTDGVVAHRIDSGLDFRVLNRSFGATGIRPARVTSSRSPSSRPATPTPPGPRAVTMIVHREPRDRAIRLVRIDVSKHGDRLQFEASCADITWSREEVTR